MKKIVFIVLLLLITYNVKALRCEYKIDHNNVGLIITVGNDRGINASLSGGVYLMPGRTNDIGEFIKLTANSSCPPKAYYACKASKYCRINTNYFVDNDAVMYGVLELKSQSSGTVIGGDGEGEDGGHATVVSVVEDIKKGDSCGAIRGLNDLIETSIKMPLIIIGAILFLVFTTLEYAKVVFSGEGGSFKKANENTLKRGMGFGLLALSPFIIQLLLSLAEIPAC